MELELPPDIVAGLREKAAATGVEPKQLAIATLKDGLLMDDRPADVMLPREKWKATFDALLASFPVRESETRVDASRESIYGDDR